MIFFDDILINNYEFIYINNTYLKLFSYYMCTKYVSIQKHMFFWGSLKIIVDLQMYNLRHPLDQNSGSKKYMTKCLIYQ